MPLLNSGELLAQPEFVRLLAIRDASTLSVLLLLVGPADHVFRVR